VEILDKAGLDSYGPGNKGFLNAPLYSIAALVLSERKIRPI